MAMSAMGAERVCPCGYKDSNKGSFVQHIRMCRKYQEVQAQPVIIRKIGRLIDRTKDSRQEEETGLGQKSPPSRCCNAEMVFDRKKRAAVCSKCGRSPWESSGRRR